MSGLSGLSGLSSIFGGDSSFYDDFTRSDGPIGNGWSGSWLIASNKGVSNPTFGSEMLTNPGFEGSYAAGLAPNWTKNGTPTVTEENSIIHGGGAAQKFVTNASADGVISNTFTVVAGRYYRVSVWARLETASKIIQLARGTSNLEAVTVTTTTTGSYVQITATWLAILDGSASVWIRSTPTGAVTWYADDASVTELTSADIYALRDYRSPNVNMTAVAVPTTGHPAGLVLRADNPANVANCIRIYFERVTAQIKVDKLVSGVWSNVSATATTYVASAALRATCTVSTVTTYYNGALVKTDTISDASIISNTYHGLLSTSSTNLFSYAGLSAYGATIDQTIYVSKSGNDSNDGLTAGTAKLTIAAANTLAGSNGRYNRILVGAGTYSETVTPPRGSITYVADGAVIIDRASAAKGFAVTRPYTRIIGFEVRNCTVGIEYSGAVDGEVISCIVHDCTDTGIYIKTSSLRTSVRNCIAHTITSGGLGIVFYDTANGTVISSEVYGHHVRGIYFYNSPNGVARDCYVHDKGAAGAYGFEVEGNSDDVSFIRCWAESVYHGFISKTSQRTRFEGCVAWDIDTYGFYFKAGVDGFISHSVAYDCGYGVELSNNSGSPPASTSNEIKNSIIANCTVYGIESANSSNVGLDSNYNNWYGNAALGNYEGAAQAALANWQSASSQDANSVAINPSFVVADYGSFSLPTGSALLTAGEAGTAIGRDGSTWDG